MEIPLLVLVLQIGINAALNNRGYNGNPLIPSARFVNSGQTRRLPDSNSYQPLSSRGIPPIDSEQSDEEYSSFEDYSFRSVRPLQSRINQRRNNYLRYNTEPNKDVLTPFDRINSNDYIENLQSSSLLSRRADANFRRPYLRNGPLNVRKSPTRKYYTKANDDLSLEVSSLESNNFEDASRLGEEASYLRSLLSLIEQPYNRRSHNRKYLRETNNLSPDVSPIDKLDPDEDAVNSLPSSPNSRRNNRKEYNNHQSDLRMREPSPVKDIPDAYIDTILLVTDDDKPDEIPIGRPKLGSLETTSLGNNNIYNRRHDDDLNLDEDFTNNLSPFRGLKLRSRSRKLTNNSPLTEKFNRKSNTGLESSLNYELLPDDDKTDQLTLLRLESLENLNLDSSLLRSGDQQNQNNRKNNRRNFLRLSLSPNNKLTLDEGVAADLSDLLSDTLDELNLVPVTLRRTGPSDSTNSRRENNMLRGEEDNLRNIPVLRLGSVDIPNTELPLRRYYELANRNYNINLRQRGNNREALKKLFDDNPVKNLVPYHEVKSNKLFNSRINEKRNYNRRDDFPDEFSLDTLFNFREEDHDDRLDLDDNFSSDLSVLRSTNQDQLSLEPPFLKGSEGNPSTSEVADETLHLEFPWNDPLSSNGDEGKSQPNKSKTGGLRSQSPKEKDITKDTTDILHLEYPWNDALSSTKAKTSDLPAVPNLNSHLRSPEQKDITKDTTDILHLEYPWNDPLSSENGKSSKPSALRSKSQLRNSKEKDNSKDTTDILHLEYPWNDPLSSDKNKSSKPSALRSKSQLRNAKEKDNSKDTTDILHLEYPWNDPLSSDKDKSSKPSALRSKSQLRNSKEKDNSKDTTDILHLEYPWNDPLSSTKAKTSDLPAVRNLNSHLRSPEQKDITKDTTDILHHEYPWNDPLSSENDKSSKLSPLRSKSQLRNSKENGNSQDTTDVLHLEYPWNDPLSSKNGKSSKPSNLRSKSKLRNSKEKDHSKDTTDILHFEYPWNDSLSSKNGKSGKLSALRSKSQLRNSKEKDNSQDTIDILHLEYPWNDPLSSKNGKSSKPSNLRSKSQLRNSKEKDNSKDTTDILHLEYPWNDPLSSKNSKSSKPSALRSKSQLRNSKEKDNSQNTTDILHLEYPWNDPLSTVKDKSGKLSALRSKSQLRNSKEKDNSKDTTDTLHLEYPWNDPLSSENGKNSKPYILRSKSQLRNSKEKDNSKDTTDLLHLEYPWNDPLSSNSSKGKSQLRSHKQNDDTKDTTDTLHLEFPWNNELSPHENKTAKLKSQSLLRGHLDSRQDKEPKDEHKLEFPWNDKSSPNKPSSKKTTLRIPDPFYVHPYLRNRNIKKHPNYFRRSSDEFTEGIRLENLKDSPSKSHLRHSNRRFNDNQSLGVLPLAREDLENKTALRDTDENLSGDTTFPSVIRPNILSKVPGGTTSLLPSMERPNDTNSLLNVIGDENNRVTYNDTIIFPKN